MRKLIAAMLLAALAPAFANAADCPPAESGSTSEETSAPKERELDV